MHLYALCLQYNQYMFAPDPNHNLRGTPTTYPANNQEGPYTTRWTNREDKALGRGGSIRDRIVFPREVPSGYQSESPSDNPTKYPSQVTIIKPLNALSETPTKYPSRVTQ